MTKVVQPPSYRLLPRRILPITNAIEQLVGGSYRWSQLEVEQALWIIGKPIQDITLHEVTQAVEYLRKATK